VFDLRTLRTLSRTTAPQVLHESAHYAGFEDAHNLAINEATGFAYIVGSNECDGGLHIVDIRTPTEPSYVGCYSGDGYIHDTTCVLYDGPDSRYQGRELCFNASVTEFTVVDVTDKEKPIRIAGYSSTDNAYIHQGWLTADQRYYIMNDELDELRHSANTRTYILNIEQIDAPSLTGIYTSSLPSIDHNLYISDTYIYEANYTTGRRVLDGKRMAEGTLTEVASFDTYPENDSAAFYGAWTAYPYFRNDTVVVSTIESGVFILRPRLNPSVVLENETPAPLCRPTLPDQQYNGTLILTARNDYTQTVMLSTEAGHEATSAAIGSTAMVSPTVTIDPATLDLSDKGQVTGTVRVDLQEVASGYYTITVIASSPTGDELDRMPIVLHLADSVAAMPAVVAQELSPAEGSGLTLTWAATPLATAYRVEVATDAEFTNIVQRAETTATTY
ncbi:MAG: choice-of-anchor B family protein, partial [Caldilineaceae bacterium]|nr:choice-of-anchor B family protein [Caldilineaceae bacterium]